jgi:SAM-dependent methyltransferase
VLSDDPDVFLRRFTNEMMDSDENYYHHLCLGEREGQPTHTTSRLILQRIHSDEGMRAQGRWLDVGSGSGYLVHALQRDGFDAIGIEPGGWGQIAARQKGIRVIQGFLEETTLLGKFDFVSATDVLEHQPDPGGLLDLIGYYLRPSGTAFITVPFVDSFHGRILRSRWSMVEPPTHSQFFSLSSFESLLRKCGFELVGMVRYNVTYPWPLGRLKLGRKLVDWLLSATMGGDQALFIVRLRP